jgi:DNA-binding transcriptional LysR family regulator
MRDLDLKSLRLLVAVCEHQNMARAAAQEHIEPSAISKRIAQLEADLGTPLLLRSRRGVSPTPAGVAVLEHARNILFTLDRVVAANLAISVIPVEAGGPHAETLGIRLIPLTDAWAQRRFAVCFQDRDALQPAVRRMVDHLVERARVSARASSAPGTRA